MAQTKRALEPKEQTVPVLTEVEENIFEQFKETVQSIADRAFEFFEKRGYQFGHEVEDWLRAESEFIRRLPLEVKEANGNLNIRAELPGFKPEDLKVYVEPLRLTISGEMTEKTEKTGENTLHSEWQSRKVFRAFDLPLEVKPADARATLKDGILMLTVPKAELAEPVEIKVESTE